MPLPRLCNHEIAESDFPPILVADDGNDEDEDEEEDEEERRRDEEEEEEEPIWTAPPSGRGSCASRPPVPSGVAKRSHYRLP